MSEDRLLRSSEISDGVGEEFAKVFLFLVGMGEGGDQGRALEEHVPEASFS